MIRVMTLLLAALCLTQPAFAQINPFRGSRSTPLNADDIAALTAATNRLLDLPDLVPGNSETWSNPASGASGTITAGKAVRRKGFACRMMDYQATVPGPRAGRRATLTWCKTPDGWRLG